MTLREKWSALFHIPLYAEERVTPELALEALCLVQWMRDKWRGTLLEEGYSPVPVLCTQADVVLCSLRAKAFSAEPPGLWPTEILQGWERQRPFHITLGGLLDSHWEPLFELLRRDQSALPSVGRVGPCAIRVVAKSPALRNAWVRVLGMFFRNADWDLGAFGSVADLPQPSTAFARVCLVFGSPWDTKAQAAALDVWRKGAILTAPVVVINTCTVAEAIRQLLIDGQR